MSDRIGRRGFIKRAWQAGLALVGAAGAWTSWDVLKSVPASGLGGVVKTVPEGEITEVPVYVRSAQTYLTRIEGEVVALWQRCPHLGCRVSWCESSREFECACHGSAFNRAGEVRAGPAPRGMDRFTVNVADGVVEVDTGAVAQGAVAGTDESIDEPKQGPSCAGHA
jgi:nitrite reductase/ring-hydroxylating ferredoxin subunit